MHPPALPSKQGHWALHLAVHPDTDRVGLRPGLPPPPPTCSQPPTCCAGPVSLAIVTPCWHLLRPCSPPGLLLWRGLALDVSHVKRQPVAKGNVQCSRFGAARPMQPGRRGAVGSAQAHAVQCSWAHYSSIWCSAAGLSTATYGPVQLGSVQLHTV